jgi:hypothetical protein
MTLLRHADEWTIWTDTDAGDSRWELRINKRQTPCSLLNATYRQIGFSLDTLKKARASENYQRLSSESRDYFDNVIAAFGAALGLLNTLPTATREAYWMECGRQEDRQGAA